VAELPGFSRAFEEAGKTKRLRISYRARARAIALTQAVRWVKEAPREQAHDGLPCHGVGGSAPV